MRLSLVAKLLVSFALVLALALAPAYFYVRRGMQDKVLSAVEQELTQHARTVAARLAAVPDKALDDGARALANELVARVTLIGLEGEVLAESVVPKAMVPHPEAHPDREPYLSVTRPLLGTDGRPRGTVRVSRPVGDLSASFRDALRSLYRAAGAAASMAVVLSLATTLLGVRPLRRLRLVAQAYARGEYTAPLPSLPRDELGDLGEALGAMSRRVQREMVRHSADGAHRTELLRVLPVPLLLLGPDLEVQEMNAAFRDAVDVDPATEAARLHQLCQLRPLRAAREAAEATLQAQRLTLELPWNRMGRILLLCPLPAPGGRVSFALLVEGWHNRGSDEGLPSPEDVVAEDLHLLLGRVLGELNERADAAHVQISVDGLPQTVMIADAGGRTERALREALLRSLPAVAPPWTGGAPAVLAVAVHIDVTSVQLQLSGLLRPVRWEDLDQLVSPLGGSVGPARAQSAMTPDPLTGTTAGALAGATFGPELWIELRRA